MHRLLKVLLFLYNYLVLYGQGNGSWPLTLSGGTDCSKVDETSERRSNQDTSISESEQQLGSRLGPTLLVLPFPAILVGYGSLVIL